MKKQKTGRRELDAISHALDAFGEHIDEDNDDCKCLNNAWAAFEKLETMLSVSR